MGGDWRQNGWADGREVVHRQDGRGEAGSPSFCDCGCEGSPGCDMRQTWVSAQSSLLGQTGQDCANRAYKTIHLNSTESRPKTCFCQNEFSRIMIFLLAFER